MKRNQSPAWKILGGVLHGITIDGHPLREHLEATNHAEAYTAMTALVSDRALITVDTRA